MNKLNIQKLQKEKKTVKIGELTQNIINILEINQKPKNIKLGYDRIEHCNKHIKDFATEQSYNNSMESIPQIINTPDYVGYNNKNNSIEYIKRIDELTLIAIRLRDKGDLYLRSLYPISESKLQYGIKQKRIKKVKRDTT